MNLKRIFIFILALVMVLSLAACGKDKPSKEDSQSESIDTEVEFPVSIGDSVRISEKPERVVSLSPAVTEIIFELGFEGSLAGVSDYCDYPDVAADYPKCGSVAGINIDEIYDIAPDLVITSSPLLETDLVKLQQADIEVLVVTRAHTLATLSENYVNIATAMAGNITGKAEGEKLYQNFADALDEMEAQAIAYIENAEKKSVIMLRYADFTMATGDSFEQVLLDKLKLTNLAEMYGDWTFPESEAATLNMDYIISDNSITIPDLEKNATYKGTQAVIKDRVVTVDFTAFERQTPRMMVELWNVVDGVYPVVAEE